MRTRRAEPGDTGTDQYAEDDHRPSDRVFPEKTTRKTSPSSGLPGSRHEEPEDTARTDARGKGPSPAGLTSDPLRKITTQERLPVRHCDHCGENLADTACIARLRKHESSVLQFAREAPVASSNNLSERHPGVSMVKRKAAGCFRTHFHAEAYGRISSYLQSMATQGYNPPVEIQLALQGRAVVLLDPNEIRTGSNIERTVAGDGRLVDLASCVILQSEVTAGAQAKAFIRRMLVFSSRRRRQRDPGSSQLVPGPAKGQPVDPEGFLGGSGTDRADWGERQADMRTPAPERRSCAR